MLLGRSSQLAVPDLGGIERLFWNDFETTPTRYLRTIPFLPLLLEVIALVSEGPLNREPALSITKYALELALAQEDSHSWDE